MFDQFGVVYFQKMSETCPYWAWLTCNRLLQRQPFCPLSCLLHHRTERLDHHHHRYLQSRILKIQCTLVYCFSKKKYNHSVCIEFWTGRIDHTFFVMAYSLSIRCVFTDWVHGVNFLTRMWHQWNTPSARFFFHKSCKNEALIRYFAVLKSLYPSFLN